VHVNEIKSTQGQQPTIHSFLDL